MYNQHVNEERMDIGSDNMSVLKASDNTRSIFGGGNSIRMNNVIGDAIGGVMNQLGLT